MLCMEVCPCNYFWWCGYFWSPCVSIVLTDEFSVRVTKITSRISVSDVSDFGHFLLKGCKPDNLESYNSWKLSLTNIWDLCLNFMECESFLETLLTFLLYVRQTWMTQLIQVILLWNFTFICMVLQFTRTKEFLLLRAYLYKTANSYLCFRLALLHSVT